MPPDERLRPNADRLACLLASPRGSEVVVELQKLALRTANEAQRPSAPGITQNGFIGRWRAEKLPEGVALHRRDVCPEEETDWADVAYVPPQRGSRRVVLIGESAARGWPYEPFFSCAAAIDRQLAAAAPGSYQCVDLAKTGATASDLISIAEQLPLIEPDIVVAFAGNNWVLPPEDHEFLASSLPELEIRDTLADALRAGTYGALRRQFISAVVLARAQGFLDQLTVLHKDHGVEIIVVIPEFNLVGWQPPYEVEVPVLPPADMARWYELGDQAEDYVNAGRWAEIEPIVAKMRQLDGGTSPVTGQLLARAAMARGDGRAARIALEDSRDAMIGLYLRYPPRTMREVQVLLAEHAQRQGFRCVDLRRVLASDEIPELPDRHLFHDYCHLSDTGIERAMSAVADAVLGREPGTTCPGAGADPSLRAFTHARAAIHSAYHGQPADVVVPQLRTAIDTDPALVPALCAVRDLLVSPRPAWLNPAVTALAVVPGALQLLVALIRTRGLSPDLWILLECLIGVLGDPPYAEPSSEIDLLEPPDPDGHALTNWTPARCYHQATAERSFFYFAFDEPRDAVLNLTYRTPMTDEGGPVAIHLNGDSMGQLPARNRWSDTTLEVPAGATRTGINKITFRWPIPRPDADACRNADAAALARGDYPYVLPVFGEVFEARLTDVTGSSR